MSDKKPTAEDIARAMVKVQQEEAAKSRSGVSDVLGWGGMLLVAPGGAALWALVDRQMGTFVCAAAFVMVIVGAVMGSMAKR